MRRRLAARAAVLAVCGISLGCNGSDPIAGAKPVSQISNLDKASIGPTASPSPTPPASDTALVDLGDDATEQQALTAALASDTELSSLTDIAPLINDGGAVFLGDSSGTSPYRIQAVSLPPAPHWRRFGMVPVEGAEPTTVETTLPGNRNVAAGNPGYRVIVFHRAQRTAEVLRAQHFKGTFGLDLPPYDDTFGSATSIAGLLGVTFKAMDVVALTHVRFEHRRVGWKLQGVAPNQVKLVDGSSQTVHIAQVKVDLHAGPSDFGPPPADDIASRDNFQLLPAGQSVYLKVKVEGAKPGQAPPAEVFVRGIDEQHPLKLFDDATNGDDRAGDHIYSAVYPAPPSQAEAPRIVVDAFSEDTIANPDGTTYDGETWLMPFKAK